MWRGALVCGVSAGMWMECSCIQEGYTVEDYYVDRFCPAGKFFQLLRYGRNEEIKSTPEYKTDIGMIIRKKMRQRPRGR